MDAVDRRDHPQRLVGRFGSKADALRITPPAARGRTERGRGRFDRRRIIG
jgi:hypothetical protein